MLSSRTIKDIEKEIGAALAAAKVCADASAGKREAVILMGHLLEKPRHYFLTHGSDLFPPGLLPPLERLFARRLKSEPMAYIIGSKEFMGLNFRVDPRVLIPRPDTEILVEAALDFLGLHATHATHATHAATVLDLCTGSGCILISVLEHFHRASPHSPPPIGLGVDISDDAIALAKVNSQSFWPNSDASPISWLAKDLLEAESWRALPKADLILSNPPYISWDDIQMVAKETLLYEPRLALFPEHDHLCFYRVIAEYAHATLSPGGRIMIEIGIGDAKKVADIFALRGYRLEETKLDLSGIERTLIFSLGDLCG